MPSRFASSTPSLRVVIAGGGTGGHVIPALAIGRELKQQHGAELLYIGTSRGLETKLVPAAGFPLELVRSGQLKNVSLKTRLKTLSDLPAGVLRCIQLLRRFRPAVVVGVGGYASGPAILAAALLRIPTLAYEPNAVPGMTNRLAGRFTSAAAVAFPQTTRFFRNAEITGVPVRPEIFLIAPRTVPAASEPRPAVMEEGVLQKPGEDPAGAEMLRLLVTAGSQGAAVFNTLLPRVAGRLLRQFPGLTIVHQAGPRHLETTRAAYAADELAAPAATEGGASMEREVSGSGRYYPITVEAFLEDMPAQYAAADLILARSGSTVAELCAAGRASLLVPFPQAADDHQRRNAEVLVEDGAAEMLLQADATEESLLQHLAGLLADRERRDRLARNARSLARPGALARIAAMVVALSGTSS